VAYYINGKAPRGKRWFIFLGILIFFAFIFSGSLIIINYHNFGNLFKVISLIRSQYLYPVSTKNLVEGATKGIVESLGDPYSIYLDPDTYAQLKEQINGTFGGLGILVGLKNDYLTVMRSYEGTPAYRKGIKAGDIVLKVNNRETKGIDLDTAIGLMRGAAGTKVKLIILRQNEGIKEANQKLNGKTEFTVELTREEISIPTVEGHILKGTKIGYLTISQFTTKTPTELEVVLGKFKKSQVQGILLDLRNNPGGELRAAVEVAEKFIPKGPVVYVDYRSGKKDTYSVNGSNLTLPLVVLVNEASASAAEILAGAIKDRKVGILIGEKTFGKGVVQTVFDLGNGAGLKLTTARYLTPAKHNIHRRGISPDIIVKQKLEAEKDLQKEKALEILQQKLAA
jgi:carboxyl-terminal processing protease